MAHSAKDKSLISLVYKTCSGIGSREITFSYEGEITHQLMKDFCGVAMKNMEKENEGPQLSKMVYHVMIECLQNITMHAYQGDTDLRNGFNSGVLLVSKDEDNYYVTTGNTVRLERTDYLKDMLLKINSLNRKQLDELYRQQLREGKISDKGGAGLGIIDIRRKTGQDLDFTFVNLDDQHSFFLLSSKIKRNI